MKHLLFSDHLYHYLIENSVRESQPLRLLREATEQLPESQMMAPPEEAQFLAWLVTLTKAQRVIEIGVFTGYTTLALAQALPDTGTILACDISEKYPAIGQPYWQEAGVAHKIHLHIQPALDTLRELIDNKQQNTFDFIFIDANKTDYAHYYECALALVKQGGIIAIDNTLAAGSHSPFNTEDHRAIATALRKLNQDIHNDPRVSLCILPVATGLTLVYKL